MRFFFPAVISIFIAACTEDFKPGDFPVFEYDPALEKTDLALDYGDWNVTLAELRTAFPELPLLEEDLTAARTAAVLTLLKEDMAKLDEVEVYGCRREACLLAISRIDPTIDTKKLSFLGGERVLVKAGPHWVDVYKQKIYHLETAIQQTQYFFKAHRSAEKLLSKKMPVGAFATDLYARPIRSRWPKPVFRLQELPKKFFVSGKGEPAVVTLSSFDCKTCLAWNREIPKIVSKSHEVRYYPNFSERDLVNRSLFEAALCLEGREKTVFWQWLEQWTSPLKEKKLRQDIEAWLKDKNIGTGELYSCIESKKFQTQLEEYQKFSSGIGTKTYPVVVTGDFAFAGAIEKDEVLQALDIERRQLQHKGRWRPFKRLFQN